ncbi:MAG: DUF2169 domain-containing protein [Kiloniellales bacterium]|nr:DUF2169 domain-containing protein [Kiloniellales bacterium]
MWSIDNQTPFAAERAWVRDKTGAEVWLVGVKATFDVLPDGGTGLAPEQVPVRLFPEFRGDPGTSSMLHDSDLLLDKPGTDVLLEGQAHSPEGPVKSLEIGFRVAGIQRRARVVGDRRWEKTRAGLAMTPIEPFTRMPLAWERSFGGIDLSDPDPEKHAWEQRNPVGRGFATEPEHLLDKPLPNIEDPRQPIRAAGDRPEPMGFGPIAHHWQPRVGFSGTYDDRWLEERQPLLPEDFDFRYQHCAPQHQQSAAVLKGGEEVVLVNLTPGGGRLSFRLPRLAFVFSTRFSDGSSAQHRGQIKTVALEGDQPRVSMLWVSALPCHHKVQKLLSTTVSLKERIMRPREEVDSGMWQPA